MSTSADSPDALLLVGRGCPHCAAVRRVLGALRDAGEIARPEVVDVAEKPGLASLRRARWQRITTRILGGLASIGRLNSTPVKS